jgi:D-alanine-D-alanine ligase
MEMGKLRIALLAGGWSGEREVSLKSGEAVYKALDRNKYDVIRYDPRDDLISLIRNRANIDLAFALLHGKFGEDGSIQGFLDLLGVPFVGSGLLASAMALNKKIAKEAYERNGLEIIKDIMLRKGEDPDAGRIEEALGPSTVVKPVEEGSSLGMSVCHSRDELIRGIDLAFQHGDEVMVEQFVKGRELTCCVIGNRDLEALPLVEIIPDAAYTFFDYEAKYTPGATREICPAPVAEALGEKARSCAKRAHEALKCRVWSRSDMILKGEKVYVLETNTIPGMTETSLVPLSARTAGMSLSQFLDRLIALSLEEPHSV